MSSHEPLTLNFSGRILEHLGIQMYQSPVAAIAEIISNTWDADAEIVKITIPTSLGSNAKFVVQDNGHGMTREECQEKFLAVGRCRRAKTNTDRSPEKKRRVLGRKGIGKFAGFGIANVITIETISKETGERTVFRMDIEKLMSDDYVSTDGKNIEVLEHSEADDSLKANHGTIIRLTGLKISQRSNIDQFLKSMGRRFLLYQRSDDFKVTINGKPLPEDADLADTEFRFPENFEKDEIPAGVKIEDGWAIETLSNGFEVKWRMYTYKDTIDDDELRGITVFAHGKLAQKPFFFNLTGGLGGQHGIEYLSGQFEADFVDELKEDMIATERQRINFSLPETEPLLLLGQERLKSIIRIWKKRRGAKRRKELDEKTATFSPRLEKLEPHERRTVNKAIDKLATISSLGDAEFLSLGEAILTAWEHGRLHNLIDELAETEDFAAGSLLELLVEADVLAALSIAESIKTKLEAVRGLRRLVEASELENDVRDYIAEKPYLLNRKWETFIKEESLNSIMKKAAGEAKLNDEPDEQGRKRVDLGLRSGENALIVEFMRPGKKLDWDHLSRCELYVGKIRVQAKAETLLGIKKVTGLIVADKIAADAALLDKVATLAEGGIQVQSWPVLLDEAESEWREYLDILGDRAPDDERLKGLRDG